MRPLLSVIVPVFNEEKRVKNLRRIDGFLYKTWLHPTQYLAAAALFWVVWKLGRAQVVTAPEK